MTQLFSRWFRGLWCDAANNFHFFKSADWLTLGCRTGNVHVSLSEHAGFEGRTRKQLAGRGGGPWTHPITARPKGRRARSCDGRNAQQFCSRKSRATGSRACEVLRVAAKQLFWVHLRIRSFYISWSKEPKQRRRPWARSH